MHSADAKLNCSGVIGLRVLPLCTCLSLHLLLNFQMSIHHWAPGIPALTSEEFYSKSFPTLVLWYNDFIRRQLPGTLVGYFFTNLRNSAHNRWETRKPALNIHSIPMCILCDTPKNFVVLISKSIHTHCSMRSAKVIAIDHVSTYLCQSKQMMKLEVILNFVVGSSFNFIGSAHPGGALLQS